MADQIEILNGDDRALALRRLKTAAKNAKSAATRKHLLSVLRSLNPNAARSRASTGASSMAKSTKKAAHHKGPKKHTVHKSNPTTGATYQLQQVGSKVKSKVAAAGRRAVSNFKGFDLVGILTEGAGVGLGLVGTSIVSKQADKMLPASFPAVVKSALATAVVGGLAVAVGGTRGFTRYVAVGAIGEFIQNTARTYLPSGLMAGTDAADAAGYWDPNTGQWVQYGQPGIAGIIYDPAYGVPASADERPVSI